MRVLLPLLLLFMLAGCVQRTISITSEPSGVLVMLNDEEVGRTPLQVPFTWYGTYDVRLERAGYQPKWTTAEANAPWWEWPGPDLVAEAIPGAESHIAWHFTLEPNQPIDEPAFVDRARQLQREANLRGNVEVVPDTEATPADSATPTTAPAPRSRTQPIDPTAEPEP